jgi:hypothetical protein
MAPERPALAWIALTMIALAKNAAVRILPTTTRRLRRLGERRIDLNLALRPDLLDIDD